MARYSRPGPRQVCARQSEEFGAREAIGLDAGVQIHQRRYSRITEVARMGLKQ